MSIGCTEMARKVRKKHNEQIGAENDEEMEKNCEDKSAVVGRNQNQNGVVFFSSLEMQRKSLLCSWTLKVLDFYSTCKHSLTILCTFLVIKCYLVENPFGLLTRVKSILKSKLNIVQIKDKST